MRIQFSKAILAVAISSTLGLGIAWGQAQQEKKPEWKDRAEYELVQSISAEKDANKQLELLNQWKEKYPNTDFKVLRLESYLNTYRALGNAPKMFDAAQELLTQDPKNLLGLYWANLLIISMNDSSPAKLDAGEKVANGVLSNVNDLFAAEKKPATATEEVWKQTRTTYETLAHRTLAWVQWQRKNYTEAEAQCMATLKLNPNDAEVSYWLGTVILGQKKPERQAEAIFDIARAAAYDGPGAMGADRRKQIEAYVKRAYTTYHGQDEAGFAKLMEVAKANTFPPADFKVLSQDEWEREKLTALQSQDPSLALWVTLKTALTSDGGEKYFEDNMKGALVPPEGQPAFRATVISQTPKALVVAISDATTPEATIKFETPVTSKLEPGAVIHFRGTAMAFTKSPFNVTFDSEKKLVTGWPAPPAPAKKAPVRKATKKKGE